MTKTNSINIISLVQSYNDLPSDIYQSYIESKGIKIKDSEIEDLHGLITSIQDENNGEEWALFNNFYVGYSIEQIGKEFDLLRLGSNYIFNIEIKRSSTEVNILNQLRKNSYYLDALQKSYHCVTYEAETKKLFYYEKQNDSLSVISTRELIKYLEEQKVEVFDDIGSLFDPTEYLVSPFNSTDRFINGEYFLTEHQKQIKKEIKKMISPLYSIQGRAGTGKTLLIYDLAKDFKNNDVSFSIIHCGQLNSGHIQLKAKHGWPIVEIKHIKRNEDNFNDDLDILVIDESQRIDLSQFKNILREADEKGITCIFSFDPAQCLHDQEIRNKIPIRIKERTGSLKTHYELTGKIRTNKEIGAFIKNLFNLNNKTPEQAYNNIELQYFSDINFAKDFIQDKVNSGWTTINYTTSRFNMEVLDKYTLLAAENAHTVIGQEFDNVIAVMGEMFQYDDKGNLINRRRSYYHSQRMLFQIITRTRKRLFLVIINNDNLLKNILNILK